MFAAHLMLLVLLGADLWHATEAQEWHEDNYDGDGREHWDKAGHRGYDEHHEREQHEDKNHSGSDDGKYGNWTCVCNSSMTNATNSTLWKDHEHWDNEHWDEEGHRDHEHGGENEDDERWGKDDGRWERKRCMCGSMPGHWKFIGRHGKESKPWGERDKEEHEGSHHWNKNSEQWDDSKKKQRDKDDKKKYKGSHHENKDIDIGLVMGLFAGGTVAGGVMVAVICFACQRKRVWVAAPPVTGTSVFDRPAMDDVNQTHVVVGTTVEKGQVPIAQERANAKANVIADLECGAGNQSAI